MVFAVDWVLWTFPMVQSMMKECAIEFVFHLYFTQVRRGIYARMVPWKWNFLPIRWHEIWRWISRWTHLGPGSRYLQWSLKWIPEEWRFLSRLQIDKKEKLSRHCSASAKNRSNGSSSVRTAELIKLKKNYYWKEIDCENVIGGGTDIVAAEKWKIFQENYRSFQPKSKSDLIILSRSLWIWKFQSFKSRKHNFHEICFMHQSFYKNPKVYRVLWQTLLSAL